MRNKKSGLERCGEAYISVKKHKSEFSYEDNMKMSHSACSPRCYPKHVDPQTDKGKFDYYVISCCGSSTH